MGIKLQFPTGVNKLALKAEDAKITPDCQGLVFFFSFFPLHVIFLLLIALTQVLGT